MAPGVDAVAPLTREETMYVPAKQIDDKQLSLVHVHKSTVWVAGCASSCRRNELIPVLQDPHIFERDRTDRLREHRPQNQVTVPAMPFRRAQFMRRPSPHQEKTSTASPTFQMIPLFENRE
jgi:hypothetical protein